MKKNLFLIVLFATLFAFGCGEKKEIDPKVENLGRASSRQVAPKAATKRMPMGMGMQRQDAANSVVYDGKITETINVPNYTYLKIKPATGTELWTAVPSCDAKVGDQVKVKQSLIMKKFTSPSLSRTFDEIIFGTLDSGNKTPALPLDAGMPPGHPPINKAAAQKLPPGHPPVN